MKKSEVTLKIQTADQRTHIILYQLLIQPLTKQLQCFLVFILQQCQVTRQTLIRLSCCPCGDTRQKQVCVQILDNVRYGGLDAGKVVLLLAAARLARGTLVLTHKMLEQRQAKHNKMSDTTKWDIRTKLYSTLLNQEKYLPAAGLSYGRSW